MFKTPFGDFHINDVVEFYINGIRTTGIVYAKEPPILLLWIRLENGALFPVFYNECKLLYLPFV